MRGKFIVMEGLDGSGKGTQIELLFETLVKAGRRVHLTAEPTESVTGGLIREALSGMRTRESAELAALFLADRVNHNLNPVNGIKKMLDSGADVLCDRYYYSSLAYQAVGDDRQWVTDMNLNCPEIEKPDLCIFLDVEPESCKRRIDEGRLFLEIYEKDLEEIRKIRQRYFAAFELLNGRDNIVKIDAARPPQDVARDVADIVMKML